jgi:hypothetical protein
MFLRTTILAVAALAIGMGWYQMFRFAATPGEQGAAPEQWPREIPSPWPGNQATHSDPTPTLVVFIHPRCSCTPATLEQLDRILDQSHVAVRIALAVYRSKVVDEGVGAATNPPGDEHATSPGLAEAGLLHRAFKIVPDLNGELARRFGAATSGEIVLYAADGQRLFQGGITAERSHLGDSAGGAALRNALETGAAQNSAATVFGCPIFSLGHRG